MKQVRIIFVVCVACAVSTLDEEPTPVYISKCCPPTEALARDTWDCETELNQNDEERRNETGTGVTEDDSVILENLTNSYPDLRDVASSFPVRYDGTQELNCSHRTMLRVSAQESHRIRLLKNGALVLLSPTTSGNTSALEFSPSSYCIDKIHGTNDVVFQLCPCDRLQCVSKCCPEGFIYRCTGKYDWKDCICERRNGTKWSPFHEGNSPVPKNVSYEILYGNGPRCRDGETMVVSYTSFKPYHVNLYSWGYPEGRVFADASRYCGDLVQRDNWPLEQTTARCRVAVPYHEEVMTSASYAVHIPAAALLAATLAVTAAVPQARASAHGWAHQKALTCHAAAFFVFNAAQGSYLFFSFNTFCRVTPFIMHFSLVAATLWLNVIAINMAWGFWGGHAWSNTRRARLRLFVWYALYGWGAAAALTAFSAAMWQSRRVPPYLLRPTLMETRSCFGEQGNSSGKLATFAYYYGPMGGLLLVNILLFVSTIVKVQHLRRRTSILRRTDSKSHNGAFTNQKSVMLYVKLLSVLGVAEMAVETSVWASTHGQLYQYYYTLVVDVLDLVRAASIFALACCNARAAAALRKALRALLCRRAAAKEDIVLRSRSSKETIATEAGSKG